MCITVSRRGKCFCDGRPCATVSVTKCEKDGKVYAEEFIESQKVSEVSNTSPNTHTVVLLSRTHPPHHGLYGLVTTFCLSVFASVFASVS